MRVLLLGVYFSLCFNGAAAKTEAEWVKKHVETIRATQPKDWPSGETPWPQAPKDGVIIYTGDGR